MLNPWISRIGLIASTFFLNATVNDCGAGKSIFTLNAASLTPTDPAPGEEAKLYLEYTVPAGVTVTDGTAEYDTTWNFIPFEPTIEPLCQDIPCPLGPGQYQNTSTSTWPTGVSGLLDTQMKWLDTESNLLLCVEISATLQTAAVVPVPEN